VLRLARVDCFACGVKTEVLEWLAPHARMTRRLAESIAVLCRAMTVEDAADYLGLGWDAVKAADKAILREGLDPPDFSGLRLLGLDEFAIRKGHSYATIFVDLGRRRVLWVEPGRRQEDAARFFELLGPEGCLGIQAVAIDMSTPYEEACGRFAPQAQIVWDPYHVIAAFHRLLDLLRNEEARKVPKGERSVIKGSKYLLLKARRNLIGEQHVRLQELLSANRTLAKAYILKEDLAQLWKQPSAEEALRWFQGWFQRATHSRVERLRRFAWNLWQRWEGIAAFFRFRISTSLLEGIINTIKVLKRRAYGYLDLEYFFLKIRAAFPGRDSPPPGPGTNLATHGIPG